MRRVSLLLALLLVPACRGVDTDRPLILTISDITAPAQVAVGAALHLTVTVQTGGCISFDRLDVERLLSRVTIVARGTDHSGPAVLCTADIRQTPQPLDIASPLGDPFTVVAMEPNGTTLERVVRVR